MQSLKQIFRSAELFVSKFENNRTLLILAFTALYSIGTFLTARRKFMWNDELYTYYIAHLPTMTDVWGALMSGGEQLPPFFYILTRASLTLFGDNNIALRLPEIIGFWVMCVCLFIFVARRTSNYFGLLAAIFPMLSGAYYYASEARPYGLVLGFAALALLCWQSATINYFRSLSIICLALSLAGALSNHYYGILVIFPLVFGESLRTVIQRRVDTAVWAAFALSLLPLYWHSPLIEQARAYSGTFWSPPDWMQIPNFYSNLLWDLIIPILILIFLLGAINFLFMSDEENCTSSNIKSTLPVYEFAAVFGFILIPIVCVILAKFVTGAFTDRYAIPAIIGLSILFSLVVAKQLKGHNLTTASLIICCVGWFGINGYKDFKELPGNPNRNTVELFNSENEKNLPIVAADAHTFTELAYYGSPEVTSRLVYLADPELSLKHLKHNSVERGMIDLLKPWFKLNIVDYKPFVAAHPQFLVYGKLGFLDWIIPQLKEEGMKIEFITSKDGKFLFFVHQPDQIPNTQ